MTDFLKGLNQPQIEAVKHTEGPLLILAGAGSGKTRTLTHRIAYLVGEKNVSPYNILAVTFTNKAAGEMRARVLRLLGKRQEDRAFLPFLGTFHGVCVRLLRQESRYLGFSSQFLIFDDQDSLSAIKQAMRSLNIDEKQYTPRLIQNLISSAKNELISAEEYNKLANGPAQTIAAQVYPRYQKLLAEAQAFDFDDLLFKTVGLLKKHREVLKKWQSQFRYILIDEYQDTNHAQYELVKILAAARRNICVVGDDWQSIYSWRGANYRNILDFEKDYPDTKVIKLEQNYRSTSQILDGAQAVITKNQARSKKELWTDNKAGLPIGVHHVGNETAEADLIVRLIQDALDAKQRQLNDFAVLYRTNAQSRSIEEALIRYGVPYKIVGGVRFYERKEIKDILAYLRLIYQPEDAVSFTRVINVPPRGLGEKSLQLLFDWQRGVPSGTRQRQQELSLQAALSQASQISGLTPRAAKAIGSFGELLAQLRSRSERLGLSDLIELVIKRSGYFDYLNDGSITAADRLENVQELISVAKEYEEVGLEGFLEEVALISDVDRYDQSSDAVTLMTLHAAKGLEFPVVFIVGLEEGIFPHAQSLIDPEQLEEERRLMYVGMTRAMEELHLVHAAARLLYGRTMHNPPARFIAELGDSVQLVQPSIDTDTQEPKVNLQTGDRVKHPAFGSGTVVQLEDDEVTIKFPKIGTKRLSLAYAPLEKL